MSFFRGLLHAQDNMLEKFIFPAEKSLDAELVEALSYSSILAGLKSGTTTFNDHYFFSDAVGRACQQFGVRAFIGETLQDLGGPFPKMVSVDQV